MQTNQWEEQNWSDKNCDENLRIKRNENNVIVKQWFSL